MRRIVERHTLIDSEGFAWDAEVSIPWIWREGDPDSYRDMTAPKAGTPLGPMISLHTPNDPEHPFYGEDGPRFDLSGWAVVALLAERHEVTA